MKRHKGKPQIKSCALYLKNLQDPIGNRQTKTGAKQGNDLQIFKGQLLSHSQEDIQPEKEIRDDVVKGRMIIGKQLIGI